MGHAHILLMVWAYGCGVCLMLMPCSLSRRKTQPACAHVIEFGASLPSVCKESFSLHEISPGVISSTSLGEVDRLILYHVFDEV